MSKAFFRFLRGEINGFYLTNIHNTLNKITEEDKQFIAQFANMVFKSASEAEYNEYPIPYDMLRGIGIIAGVFPPRVNSESYSGSLHMTTSKIVDEKEYSERGLFDMNREDFNFVRTDEQEYTTDINTLASDSNRTSMIGDNDTIVGYIPEGVEVIKEDGSIDLTKILASPPEEGAYSEFYGVKYLYLSENAYVMVNVNNEVYLELIKALQWIRYNGQSIASLCKVASIICPEFLHIENIDWSNEKYGVVTYSVSTEEYELKLVKIELLKFIVQKKFPQLVLIEQQ